tara:strand:+ start:718 stop:1347 length:630 start_codon:yes stop_codon:yes gene_type:complete
MKTTLLFSGGLDSATVLFKLRAEGHEVKCLAINYGQRHRRELRAAADITEALGVELEVGVISGFWNQTALTGGADLPVGEDAANIVPNRNMVFLSLAMAHAIDHGSEAVAWGPNSDDFGTFPDCHEVFAASMRSAMGLAHTHTIGLLTPLMKMTKAEVVVEALRLGVPVGATWSCYEGGRKPCRKCGACVSRSRALVLADVSEGGSEGR